MEALFALIWLVLAVSVLVGFFLIVSRLGALVKSAKEQEALLRLIANASAKTASRTPAARPNPHAGRVEL